MEPISHEQEPTPPLIWTCEGCDSQHELSDHNSKLFLFPVKPQYSFIQFICEDTGCKRVMNYFADPVSVEEMSTHLTEIYTLTDVPDWVEQGYKDFYAEVEHEAQEQRVADGIAELHHMRQFLYVYNVEPYEFETKP